MADFTPGPWECGGECEIALTFDREAAVYPPAAGGGEYQYSGPIAVVAVNDDSGGLANARLIAAAPAYKMAWSLVHDDVKRIIFDALGGADTKWVEAAIREAEGDGDE